jgi:hypothetical protein
VLLGDLLVVVEEGRVRTGQPRVQLRGVVDGEPAEAERAELGRHREVGHDDGLAVQCRLDQREPETLPRRRQHDRVAGRVGGRHVHAVGEPAAHRHPRALQQPVQLVGVAVLRGPGEPEGGPQRLRDPEAEVDVLARDRPRRLQDQQLGTHFERGAGGASCLRAGFLGEAVVDRGGRDPAARGELGPRELVDRDVPPLGVVRWPCGDVGVSLAFPRQVVVAQHGGTSAQVLRHRFACRDVHRQRADVVGDHDVGVVQRGVQRVPRRWARCVEGEAGDRHVRIAVARDGPHPHAEALQRGGPLGRRDRYAVGHTQAVGDDCRPFPEQVRHHLIVSVLGHNHVYLRLRARARGGSQARGSLPIR